MQSHIAWGQSLIAVGIIMVLFGMAGILFVRSRNLYRDIDPRFTG